MTATRGKNTTRRLYQELHKISSVGTLCDRHMPNADKECDGHIIKTIWFKTVKDIKKVVS